mmetsp:Transcript_32361/g.52305  ORF Transcript_32361/g.52305 Transcript_32361/m.52305 type:complete len:435 (+) Transcript_32361:289-1593(+)
MFCFVGNGVTCLKTLARVCKRFQHLLKSLPIWESRINLGISGPFCLSKISPRLLQYPVKSLSIPVNGENWPDLVNSLLSFEGNLQSLEISYNDDSLPVSLLVGNLTGLTSLALNRLYDLEGKRLYRFNEKQIFEFQDSLIELKVLQNLSLTGIPIRREALQTILSQCPLVSLDLFFYNTLDKLDYNLKDLMLAISAASRLTRLMFYVVEHSWTHTLETASSLTSLKSLQTLIVRGSELTISCFALWMKAFSCLTSCDIKSLVVDSDDSTYSLSECSQPIKRLGMGNISHAIIGPVSVWMNRLSSLTELSVCFVQFLQTLNVQQNQLPFLQSLRLSLILDQTKSQRLSVRALAGIASLPRLSELSIEIYYDEDGVTFESDGVSVSGFRLLRNLKTLYLCLKGLPFDSPDEHDEGALMMMLKCAIPRCDIDVIVVP